MNTLQEIQAAKKLLKNNGYYIDNLWHILDVKNNSFECSNDLAYQILSDAIEQDGIYESINYSINLMVNWEKKNSI
tara:strand:- start:57 stop:284 length:228 start_codon:yes stop_codon:yes gene_type:complete